VRDGFGWPCTSTGSKLATLEPALTRSCNILRKAFTPCTFPALSLRLFYAYPGFGPARLVEVGIPAIRICGAGHAWEDALVHERTAHAVACGHQEIPVPQFCRRLWFVP